MRKIMTHATVSLLLVVLLTTFMSFAVTVKVVDVTKSTQVVYLGSKIKFSKILNSAHVNYAPAIEVIGKLGKVEKFNFDVKSNKASFLFNGKKTVVSVGDQSLQLSGVKYSDNGIDRVIVHNKQMYLPISFLCKKDMSLRVTKGRIEVSKDTVVKTSDTKPVANPVVDKEPVVVEIESFPKPVTVDLVRVEDMKRDVDHLVNVLKNVHVSTINGFLPEQQIAIDSLYEKIKTPQESQIYNLMISETLTKFKDGHTALYSYNESNFYNLPLLWFKEDLYVSKWTEKLEAGDKIISINDVSPDELLKKLRLVVSSENDYWIKYRSPQYFVNYSFYKYFGILQENNALKVKVLRGEKEVLVQLPVQSYKPKYIQETYKKYDDFVAWNINESQSTGYFYLSQCTYDDKYRQNVDAFFARVIDQGIKNIVVDLRNNSGGNSNVLEYFLKYLDVDQYKVGTIIRRVSNEARDRNFTKSTTNGLTYFDRKVIPNSKMSKTTQAKVYILTSAKTFSSAAMFANIYGDNKIATLVGEPSGNASTHYGYVYEVKLPATGITITTTWSHFERADSTRTDNDSVYPDLAVYSDIHSYLNNKDVQLEYLYNEVIGKK